MIVKKQLVDNTKRLFTFLWKRALIVFGAISAVMSFVTIFFDIKFLPWQFCGIIATGITISIIWVRVDLCAKNSCIINISNRLGSSRSMADVYQDNFHKFTHILRQDLLDYKIVKNATETSRQGNDFVSIRLLEGYNASNNVTDGIVYLECSEYKTYYNEIKVIAYDMVTNRELKIEFLGLDPNKKYTDFLFKIYFAKPLKPKDKFQIAFKITLKNELDVLTYDDEIMSICLLRYKKGIEKLDFNVCLDFEPSSANVLSQKKLGDNIFDFVRDDVIVEKYTPEGVWENLFNIEWSSAPYIIRWGCDKPRWKFYVVNYRR